jgi:hypothetical protein
MLFVLGNDKYEKVTQRDIPRRMTIAANMQRATVIASARNPCAHQTVLAIGAPEIHRSLWIPACEPRTADDR